MSLYGNTVTIPLVFFATRSIPIYEKKDSNRQGFLWQVQLLRAFCVSGRSAKHVSQDDQDKRGYPV